MTKIDTKLLENISAYVDQELTEKEKQAVEEQLQKSATLRETAIKYREEKEQVASLPGLEEDIYFESRFFENLNEKRIPSPLFSGYRKPILALSTLCVLFMIFYQVRPNFVKDVVDQHAQALLRLTNNLKPLLFATSLTKDDMFNFAFSKTIPLNKDNDQVIKLGVNQKGQEYIEVKSSAADATDLNYRQFVSTLRLKPEQVKEMDKILDKYSDKVAASVLVNDKNTVAINSQIWTFHNELRKELVDFAAHANPAAIKALLPQAKQVSNIVKEAQPPAQASNIYYCLSADSFFTTPLNIDLSAIQKAVDSQKLAVKINKNVAQLQKKINFQIKGLTKNLPQTREIAKNVIVSKDGNNVKVIIPDAVAPDNIYPGLDEITLRIDKLFENLMNIQVNVNEGASDGRHVVGYKPYGGANDGDINVYYNRSASRSQRVLQDTLKLQHYKNGKKVTDKIVRTSPYGLNRSFNLDSLLNVTRKKIQQAVSGREDQ